MEYQYWDASKTMLNDSDFLKKLLAFSDQIDDVDEKTIKALGDFMDNPESKPLLEETAVKNASTACLCMIKWVRGVYSLYFCNRVRPKKEKLAKAQGIVDDLNAKLAIKQKELKEINDKVVKLTNELNEAEKNKQRLEFEYDDCSKKLMRAKKPIESLGGEKRRWGELAKILERFYNNLTGDILVSAGMIAYLGAFTSAFRTKITNLWVEKCVTAKISISATFSLQQVLGDAVNIRS